MNATRHTGHCACGNVEYQLIGSVRDACYCHCESCRRNVGAAFVAWGTVDRVDFSLLCGELREHRSSPGVTRGFCGNCGTSLTYLTELRPDEIDVTLVTLEHPERVVPSAHVWVQDKLEYVTLNDGLTQFTTDRS